jgi:hypothetical protein
MKKISFGLFLAGLLSGCAGQITKHETDLMNEFDRNLGKTRIDVSNLNDVKVDVIIGEIDKGFSPLKIVQAKKTAWLEAGIHDVEIITTIYSARPTLSNPGSSYDITCHASGNLKANIAYTVRADVGRGCSFVESYTFEEGKQFYRNKIAKINEDQGKE